MLKKFSKILLLVLLVFVVSSSSLICLADEEHNHTHTTTETNEEVSSGEGSTSTDTEIYNGDLYLLGYNVVMDKLVDGNVFILGKNVEITGQINGNLFVCANTLSLNECVVNYSIFACANSVYYNAVCYKGDLYVRANKLETTYSSYVARDIKASASKITLKSAVGRNLDLSCNTLSLGENKDIPEIHGDLRYTANNEITIPNGAVLGTTTYSKQYMGNSVTGILIGFGTCIVTVLALFIILNKLTPSFVQKVSDDKFSILKLLKTFALGLATIAIVTIFVILLVGTGIGVLLALILALLFAILYIIAMPTLAIKITNTFKSVLKLEKEYMFLLALSLVSSLLYGITLIPVVGIIFNLLMKVTAIGLVVKVFLPHKELSEEEKTALEETKQLVKENKEKAKQEKLEAKAAKKEEIAKTKSDKKQEKTKNKEIKTKSKETKKKDKNN